MRKILCLVAFAVGLLWLMALGAPAEEKAAAGGREIPPVVARVNGTEITGDQYRNQWHILHRLRMKADRLSVIAPGYEESMKQEVLERLIVLELLRQKADELGIRANPAEVEEKLQEIRGSLGFAGAMAGGPGGQGPDLDTYRADITSSMKIEKLLNQEVYVKVIVGPKEVNQFYYAHLEDFKVPGQVRARHILIHVPRGATDAQRGEALEAIEKAADRIQRGEAFEQVAREVSQDGSAPQGGDLGYFGSGRMVPEFDRVAFSLQKGQVSDIVETQFGYHLIKLEDRRPSSMRPFHEVAPEIEDFLRRTKAESLGGAYIEKLRAEAMIEKIPF